MNVDAPKRNWTYIFSPCVMLAIIFAVITVIYMRTLTERGEARAYIIYAILNMLSCLVILLLIDFIIRFCLKKVKVEKKALYIWVIEVIGIVFAFGLIWAWALATIQF
jgi:lysylphosphatidylglycerol synthetase-like protein (DUF2156 family)